jgi:hypothetical protein
MCRGLVLDWLVGHAHFTSTVIIDYHCYYFTGTFVAVWYLGCISRRIYLTGLGLETLTLGPMMIPEELNFPPVTKEIVTR